MMFQCGWKCGGGGGIGVASSLARCPSPVFVASMGGWCRLVRLFFENQTNHSLDVEVSFFARTSADQLVREAA